ncbi:hypothetical protein F5883DRAFT_425014, partial [Diaporthe sp. PMI_573]
SFDPAPLSKDAEFFSHAETTPRIVIGAGQTVYYKNCTSVAVYRSENTKTMVKEHQSSAGEGTVSRGTTLIINGPNGMVQEV